MAPLVPRKVRDLFALSSDCKIREQETNLFFAEVQNKLLFAVTGHTAAELILLRADPSQPNMNLTTWSGSRVRKQDVIVAKNYLRQDEIDTLNRLVVIFLEQAELRVQQRSDLTLDFLRRLAPAVGVARATSLIITPGHLATRGHTSG